MSKNNMIYIVADTSKDSTLLRTITELMPDRVIHIDNTNEDFSSLHKIYQETEHVFTDGRHFPLFTGIETPELLLQQPKNRKS